MTTFNKEVFKGNTFSNILEEIYDNQRKKDKQINALINELKPMIEEIGDATLIVPLIKEYLEIGVKNDDLLVKMAALVQRTLNNTESSAQLGISDEEKEQLLNAVKNLK